MTRLLFLVSIFILVSAISPAHLHAQEGEGGRIVFTDPKAEDDEKLSEANMQWRHNSLGAGLMVGTDGFGFGFFYGYSFDDVFTGFADLSFSEAKDSRQIDNYNPYVSAQSPNKLNYVFRVPLFMGLQYRLFSESIVENFRPFVTGGAGPVMLYISPAAGDFFSSIGGGGTRYTFGGYVGAGANFGFDRSNVLGINVRWLMIPVPEGVAGVRQGPLDNANGFYIALNFGSTF